MMKDLVTRLSVHDMMPFDNLCVDDDHPHVKAEFASYLEKQIEDMSAKDEDKWPAVHAEYKQVFGQDIPPHVLLLWDGRKVDCVKANASCQTSLLNAYLSIIDFLWASFPLALLCFISCSDL